MSKIKVKNPIVELDGDLFVRAIGDHIVAIPAPHLIAATEIVGGHIGDLTGDLLAVVGHCTRLTKDQSRRFRFQSATSKSRDLPCFNRQRRNITQSPWTSMA